MFFGLVANLATLNKIVWKAHKAVLRGNVIFLNNKDKQKQQRYQQLQINITEKEIELKREQGRHQY